jgi:cytidylate kinase
VAFRAALPVMATLERLERYLQAEREKLRTTTSGIDEPQTPTPFVTISRQAGAGGHSLAAAMLELFARQDDVGLFGGWQVFDQKLCEIVASDPVYSRSLDSLLGEEYRTPTSAFFHQVARSTVDQDMVMARVFQIVRSVASIGKAIIVGRAGSQVTLGLGPGVRLRIVAPEEIRIKGIMELYDINERKARSEARNIDGHRARLLRAHFEVDIDDPLGYDAVWNTGSASMSEIAEATAATLRRRAAGCRPA